MDRLDYHRKVYSILDFLSELGGLYAAISTLCVISLVVVNFWGSYQFLMGDLFVEGTHDQTSPRKKSSEADLPQLKNESNNIQQHSGTSFYVSILALLSPGSKSCCFCCRPSRQQRLRSKRLSHLLDEMSISHIIRQLRVLNAATKQRCSDVQWEQLQKSHAYIGQNDLDTDLEQSSITTQGQTLLENEDNKSLFELKTTQVVENLKETVMKMQLKIDKGMTMQPKDARRKSSGRRRRRVDEEPV